MTRLSDMTSEQLLSIIAQSDKLDIKPITELMQTREETLAPHREYRAMLKGFKWIEQWFIRNKDTQINFLEEVIEENTEFNSLFIHYINARHKELCNEHVINSLFALVKELLDRYHNEEITLDELIKLLRMRVRVMKSNFLPTLELSSEEEDEFTILIDREIRELICSVNTYDIDELAFIFDVQKKKSNEHF